MARSFAITLVTELAVAAVLGVRRKKDLLNVALVNLLTNPLVVSVSYSVGFFYGARIRLVCLACLELLAVVSEAFIYKRTLGYKRLNPLLLSFILNASSYIIGYTVNNLI